MKRLVYALCFLVLLYSPGITHAGDLTILTEEWPPVSFSEIDTPHA